MLNNQFKKGELYSFITGKASTAIARRLQRNFRQSGIDITIEQWSDLYQLWKQDDLSQQQLCYVTFREKTGSTRLGIYLTRQAQHLQDKTMELANQTLNEALSGVSNSRIDIAKEVLQTVYNNLALAPTPL